MISNFKNINLGFSLVEMLVAVSILLLVMIGPITVTSRAAKSSAFSTEQSQAFFLAQEGLELAEKARNDLLLGYYTLPVRAVAAPWGRFTDSTAIGTYRDCFAAGCGLDWSSVTSGALSTPVNCGVAGNCLLRLRGSPGRSMYNYSAGTDTPYTRIIRFSSPDANSVRIVSTVTWRTGSLVNSQKVEVETYLYNIHATP